MFIAIYYKNILTIHHVTKSKCRIKTVNLLGMFNVLTITCSAGLLSLVYNSTFQPAVCMLLQILYVKGDKNNCKKLQDVNTKWIASKILRYTSLNFFLQQRVWELQEVMEEYLKRCRISLNDKSRLIQDAVRLEAQLSLTLTQLKTCLLGGDCDSRWENTVEQRIIL